MEDGSFGLDGRVAQLLVVQGLKPGPGIAVEEILESLIVSDRQRIKGKISFDFLKYLFEWFFLLNFPCKNFLTRINVDQNSTPWFIRACLKKVKRESSANFLTNFWSKMNLRLTASWINGKNYVSEIKHFLASEHRQQDLKKLANLYKRVEKFWWIKSIGNFGAYFCQLLIMNQGVNSETLFNSI